MAANQRLGFFLMVVMVTISSCAGLAVKKEADEGISGTVVDSSLGKYSLVVPEGWVRLEDYPVSYLDPDPFIGHADRQIFIRPQPKAVMAIDLMLTVSDGRTVLPAEADCEKVADFLSSTLKSGMSSADNPPQVSMTGRCLEYRFVRKNPHVTTRFLGKIWRRPGRGYLVLAVAGEINDPGLEPDFLSTIETLALPEGTECQPEWLPTP